jgi:probable rRNA maturation factor
VVTIALLSDREIRTLNRKFRRVDNATDVLSFPVPPIRPAPPTVPFLGEIAIARGVARRQARAAGHSESTEWRVLALHGLLHLLGYDHEHDDGRMQRVERKLRRKGGLREGLIDRSR